jgi:hypothetical protein
MWVTELRRAGLEACHCTEEFVTRQIFSLIYREKLAFDSLSFIDLSHNPAPSKTLTFTPFSLTLNYDLICLLCCLALSTKEVATAVKLMFDTPLTGQGSEVPPPFSSENPLPEVMYCLSPDCIVFYDNIFPLDEPRGPFLKSSRMWFCPVMMMMALPVHPNMMLPLSGRC